MLSYTFMVSTIGAAVLYGDSPERRGGMVLSLMLTFGICATVAGIFGHRQFNFVDPVALLEDIFGLVGFGFIGIFSKRVWPLWASAFQLLSVGAHFVRALDLPVKPIVYAWMKSGPTWAVLFLLIYATIVHRHRRSHDNARSSPT